MANGVAGPARRWYLPRIVEIYSMTMLNFATSYIGHGTGKDGTFVQTSNRGFIAYRKGF